MLALIIAGCASGIEPPDAGPWGEQLLLQDPMALTPWPAPRAEPCAEMRGFYDALFEPDTVEVTVVEGYWDAYDASAVGVLTEQLLQIRRVPIFLNFQAQYERILRTLFGEAGFTEIGARTPDLEFERPFSYRGRSKRLHVRYVSSTVRCEGEALDEVGVAWRHHDRTCPAQQAATLRAKRALADALAESAIVVYSGHTRFGRGMDFGPLGLDEGKLRIDCSALDCERVKRHPMIFFHNGCHSMEVYGEAVRRLRAALPRPEWLAFIGNRGDAQRPNGGRKILRLLRALTDGECSTQVLTEINRPDRVGEDTCEAEADGL